jgi:hypothetical protein
MLNRNWSQSTLKEESAIGNKNINKTSILCMVWTYKIILNVVLLFYL